MASVIVDSKHQGRRVSVSIDDYLYGLFEASLLRDNATTLIREAIANGEITNSVSARYFVLQRIVKPSVINAYSKINGSQMDIEDF